MKKSIFAVRAKVWLYPGMAGWHFVTIDKQTSKKLKEAFGDRRVGFGSIPVSVTLGKTTWSTSVFPEKGGTYLLPLKSEVRKKESVVDGATISFSLVVR